MEKRDYIKAQIEQLGKMLSLVVAKFMGLKLEGKAEQGIEVSQQTLKSELDLDVDKILALDPPALTEYLDDRHLTADHIEKLTDYFIAVADYKLPLNEETAVLYYEKVLQLYGIIDATSHAYSFERFGKEERIKGILQENGEG